MATYQKRGRSWRAIVRKNGATTTATFDTKAEAVEWATITEAKILAGEEPKQAARLAAVEGVSFAKLAQRYADEISVHKKGRRWEQCKLPTFGRDYELFRKPAASITGPDMAKWRDDRLKQVKPDTVRRELIMISSVFTQAIKEWNLGIEVNPCRLITRPKSAPPRKQRVSETERKTIATALGWDCESQPRDSKQWAAFAFYLGIETAMRKGEILSVTWANVHLDDRYIHLGDTKNGDERDVPLSSSAVALLKLLKPRSGGTKLIPVQSGHLDVLFREARDSCGLRRIRFHDSRREAATTMSRKLSNVLELAAVTGHKSLQTLKIYYAPKPGDLAAKLG